MSDTRQTPTIQNRKARRDFHILDTYEVGIMLTGTEVKSIRASHIHMGESFVTISDDLELFWHQANIEEYSFGNRNNHRPQRIRKLLAHKQQILKMDRAVNLKGRTIIPLKLYFSKGFAKLEIGVATGKDNQDRRQDLIKRTQTREMDRAFKDSRVR